MLVLAVGHREVQHLWEVFDKQVGISCQASGGAWHDREVYGAFVGGGVPIGWSPLYLAVAIQAAQNSVRRAK